MWKSPERVQPTAQLYDLAAVAAQASQELVLTSQGCPHLWHWSASRHYRCPFLLCADERRCSNNALQHPVPCCTLTSFGFPQKCRAVSRLSY
jgi:hypothetical protein